MCKFWLRSNQGCKRGDECDFLHVTLAQGEQNVVNVNTVEPRIYECAGCKDVWTDRTGVVEHMIGNHRAYFCLNCDDWIQQKWKVFEEGWTLRMEVEILGGMCKNLESYRKLKKMVLTSTA